MERMSYNEVLHSISGRLTAGYFFVTNLGKKQGITLAII